MYRYLLPECYTTFANIMFVYRYCLNVLQKHTEQKDCVELGIRTYRYPYRTLLFLEQLEGSFLRHQQILLLSLACLCHLYRYRTLLYLKQVGM
jgi:hypothetical protein